MKPNLLPPVFQSALDRLVKIINELEALVGKGKKAARAVRVEDLSSEQGLSELTTLSDRARRLFGVPEGVTLTVPPMPPTAVEAVATKTRVRVSFAYSPSIHASQYEVWRATTDDLGQAEAVAVALPHPRSAGERNPDGRMAWEDGTALPNGVYYYWVRTVSHSGVRGPFNATNGTLATTTGLASEDFDPAVNPVEVVSALPAPGSQGRVVLLTTDNKLYRDTGTSWTTEVDGADLVPGAVDWATHISGAGKPQDNADVTAENTSADTFAVAGVPASNVAATVQNFNARNDRTGDPIGAPTIAGDGTAVDHVVNEDASVDISFEWSWTGNEADIDGFHVFMRASTDSSPYVIGTTPAEEVVYTMPASARALVLYAKSATKYFTFGARAFRVVDPDVDPSGLITSAIRQPSAAGEDPYRPENATAFHGNVLGTIDGEAAATVRLAAQNFNLRNDRLATPVPEPTVATDGTAIDHTLNTDGSADISFEWSWAGNEADIDGFEVVYRSSAASTAYTIGTTPSEETVSSVPAGYRAFAVKGVPADRYYTFGVRAVRVVDPDVAANGVMASAWVQPSAAGEDPYQPSANVAFDGNITGTIDGTDAVVIKNGALDGSAAWAKFSGVGGTLPAGEVEFDFAAGDAKGGNALNTLAVGTYTAADVEASVLNYNTRNDRNTSALTAPVIIGDGISHILNTDGSADVTVSWGYSGIEADIDGFIVYVHRAASGGTYTITGGEDAFYLRPNHRAFTLAGVPADGFYTFGVRSYRIVDPDIDPSAVKLSNIVQGSTTLYQPSANVAFQGEVGGAKYSDGTTLDALQPADPGATAGADWDANLTNRPKQWRLVSAGYDADWSERGVWDENGNRVFTTSMSYGLVEFDATTGDYIRGRSFDVYGNSFGAWTGYASDSEHVAAWAVDGGASTTITRRDDVLRPDGLYGWAEDATVYEVFLATGELGRVKCPILGSPTGDVAAGVWLKTADGTTKSITMAIRENDASVTYGTASITVTGNWQFFSVTGNIATAPTDLRLWVYHSDANWPDTTIHVWGACAKSGTSISPDDYAFAPAGQQATQRGWLAAQIRLAPKDRILAVITFDEPQNGRLDDSLPDAIKFIGGSRPVFESPAFKYRSAYTLVGKWGLGQGNGIEFYAGEVDKDPNARIDVTVPIKNGMFAGTTGTPNVDNSGDSVAVVSGLLPNWSLSLLDSEGLPAGIQPVEGTTARSSLSVTTEGLRIKSASDPTVAYGFPAIPIDDKQKYRVTIRHRSDSATSDGLYLRFNELNAALAPRMTHVGKGEKGSMVHGRTSLTDLVANGPMPGPTWVVDEYTYTPTPGTRFASFSMYNWTRATTVGYEVDFVQVTPIAKTAAEVPYSDGTAVEALRPAMPGADTTQTAIEQTININDQGAIQNASWDSGTKKIKIDFAGQRIAIGDDVYGSATPHILQEYNGGQPRFELTTGGGKFFRMDAQAGTLELGPDVKLYGLSGYSSAPGVFEYKTAFDSIDGFEHYGVDSNKALTLQGMGAYAGRADLIASGVMVKNLSTSSEYNGFFLVKWYGDDDEAINVDGNVLKIKAIIKVENVAAYDIGAGSRVYKYFATPIFYWYGFTVAYEPAQNYNEIWFNLGTTSYSLGTGLVAPQTYLELEMIAAFSGVNVDVDVYVDGVLKYSGKKTGVSANPLRAPFFIRAPYPPAGWQANDSTVRDYHLLTHPNVQ